MPIDVFYRNTQVVCIYVVSTNVEIHRFHVCHRIKSQFSVRRVEKLQNILIYFRNSLRKYKMSLKQLVNLHKRYSLFSPAINSKLWTPTKVYFTSHGYRIPTVFNAERFNTHCWHITGNLNAKLRVTWRKRFIGRSFNGLMHLLLISLRHSKRIAASVS